MRCVPSLEELKHDAEVHGHMVIPTRVVGSALLVIVLAPIILYSIGDRDGRHAALAAHSCSPAREQGREEGYADALEEIADTHEQQQEPTFETNAARTEARLTMPPQLFGCVDVVGDADVQHRCAAFRWQCWRACTGLSEYYAAGHFEDDEHANECICSGPSGLIEISEDFTMVRTVWQSPSE